MSIQMRMSICVSSILLLVSLSAFARTEIVEFQTRCENETGDRTANLTINQEVRTDFDGNVLGRKVVSCVLKGAEDHYRQQYFNVWEMYAGGSSRPSWNKREKLIFNEGNSEIDETRDSLTFRGKDFSSPPKATDRGLLQNLSSFVIQFSKVTESAEVAFKSGTKWTCEPIKTTLGE